MKRVTLPTTESQPGDMATLSGLRIRVSSVGGAALTRIDRVIRNNSMPLRGRRW